jgi:bud emergence protein 1
MIEQRREDLDNYCKTLLSLPDYISTCALLQQDLFGLDHDDVETDYAPKKGSRAIKSSTNTYYNGGVGKVKIKIVHKDDIYAVKIPADCTLQELMLRVEERLGRVPGTMKYKDDTHYTDETLLPLESEMDMEEAFILAIQRGKLTIVVE